MAVSHVFSTGADPLRLGDHPALDFLNTIATPVSVPVEWLAGGSDLISWLGWQKLITPQDVAIARRFPTKVVDKVAAEARSFRDWLRQFVLQHAGSPLAGLRDAELGPLNTLLAEGTSYLNVMAEGVAMPALATHRRWTDARQMLQPIAEAAADFICQTDFSLVRHCEGRGCTLIFLDKTKSHKRRWCSMEVCGNRAKAAAHRARQRQDADE